MSLATGPDPGTDPSRDPVAPTAIEVAESVRSGRERAVDVVERALAAVAADPRGVNAFSSVLAEHARAAARGIDILDDDVRSALPLAGVPLAVKGNVGLDNPVLRGLVDAGAVPIGFTTTPEQCVWATTDSGAHGVTRNPWDPSRTPGGSSGGSAAAVAAGMVPLAHGNDGMGSLRIPAAACGLVTLKAGRGVVPTRTGLDNWSGMSECGPLATTVADVALAVSLMADRPDLARVGEATGIRVGASTASPLRLAGRDLVRVRSPWRQAVRDSGDGLRAGGTDVTRIDLPVPDDPFLLLARWTSAVERDAAAADLPLSAMERRTRHHALLGRTLFRRGGPGDGDTRWNRSVERFRSAVERAFDDAGVDVVLTPALADVPPEATRWYERSWGRTLWANMGYAPMCGQWNVLGWPAMSVPAGFTRGPAGRDLPTAVQLVGRPGSEDRLLAVAGALERLRPWPRTARG